MMKIKYLKNIMGGILKNNLHIIIKLIMEIDKNNIHPDDDKKYTKNDFIKLLNKFANYLIEKKSGNTNKTPKKWVDENLNENNL